MYLILSISFALIPSFVSFISFFFLYSRSTHVLTLLCGRVFCFVAVGVIAAPSSFSQLISKHINFTANIFIVIVPGLFTFFLLSFFALSSKSSRAVKEIKIGVRERKSSFEPIVLECLYTFIQFLLLVVATHGRVHWEEDNVCAVMLSHRLLSYSIFHSSFALGRRIERQGNVRTYRKRVRERKAIRGIDIRPIHIVWLGAFLFIVWVAVTWKYKELIFNDQITHICYTRKSYVIHVTRRKERERDRDREREGMQTHGECLRYDFFFETFDDKTWPMKQQQE